MKSNPNNTKSSVNPATHSGVNAKGASQVMNDPRNRMAQSATKGGVGPGGMMRTMGAATKDAKHGIHTDRSTSRRTESRRDGSMGGESRGKNHRKNV